MFKNNNFKKCANEIVEKLSLPWKVFIWHEHSGDSKAAYSFLSFKSFKIILLGSSMYRNEGIMLSRYICAHEIGHFVFSETRASRNLNVQFLMETRADLFATIFLDEFHSLSIDDIFFNDNIVALGYVSNENRFAIMNRFDTYLHTFKIEKEMIQYDTAAIKKSIADFTSKNEAWLNSIFLATYPNNSE